MRAMVLRALLFPAAFCVAMLASEQSDAQQLPSGTSLEFRRKMVEWSPSGLAVGLPHVPSETVTGAPAGGAFKLPRLSSGFGYRDHPILRRRALHAGIDIPGRLGTPIYASESGVVRFSGMAGGYGGMIEIDHGNGMATRYAHLSRLLVAVGTPVLRGEVIALMGSTGRSTGSHLHFEVRLNGRAANPLGYLGLPSGSLGRSVLPGGPIRNGIAGPHISSYAKARQVIKVAE